jgi:hypothetical protein
MGLAGTECPECVQLERVQILLRHGVAIMALGGVILMGQVKMPRGRIGSDGIIEITSRSKRLSSSQMGLLLA